jgi:hypothetical protein
MKTWIKIIISIGVIGLLTLIMVTGSIIGTLNKEADIGVTIDAKHEANLSDYSNMKSKIKETAQVGDKEAEMMLQIIVGNSEARGTNGGAGGGMINIAAVQEAVPSVSLETLRNLQNIIVGSRDSWNMRQRELADLSRQHNAMFRKFPSGLILRVFGREPIDIKIVATAQSTQDFETETETETNLFSD